MTFTWPGLTVGTVVSVFVLVAVIILTVLRLIDVPAALLIAAVCALKL